MGQSHSVSASACQQKDLEKVKMLLIGITGHGKTTLVDFLGNFQSFSEQRDWGAMQLKDWHNTNTDNKDNSTKRSYIYSDIHIPTLDATVDVIDTTGIGAADLSDDEGMSNIASTVRAAQHVNAIVVVLNGTKARSDARLKYGFSKICEVLRGVSMTNIFLVLTHCQSPLDTPEGLDPQLLMSDICDGKTIPRDNIIFFDNPYAKLKRFRQAIPNWREAEADWKRSDSVTASFERGVSQMEKLVSSVSKCEPMKVRR